MALNKKYWRPRKLQYSLFDKYSLINVLRKDKQLDDEFLMTLNRLTLEDVIAIKLELASRTFNGKFYGFPLWKALPYIAKDAALKFAVSAARTKQEAISYLGMNGMNLKKEMERYSTAPLEVIEAIRTRKKYAIEKRVDPEDYNH